jgi:hypothetical protein
VGDWEQTCSVGPGATQKSKIALRVDANPKPGRHILPLEVREASIEDPADAFLVIEVKR